MASQVEARKNPSDFLKSALGRPVVVRARAGFPSSGVAPIPSLSPRR